MSKNKRIVTWTVTNALFMWAIVAGLVYGYEGAENIAVFMAWFLFIVSFGACTDDGKKRLREHGRAIPASVDYAFDIMVVCLFAWHGFIFTAAAYTVHALIVYAALDGGS